MSAAATTATTKNHSVWVSIARLFDSDTMALARSQVNKQKRTSIFRRLRDENPEPTTELRFGTPFELLVAVMLSAQATDVSVNKATAPLFAIANTPQARWRPWY